MIKRILGAGMGNCLEKLFGLCVREEGEGGISGQEFSGVSEKQILGEEFSG